MARYDEPTVEAWEARERETLAAEERREMTDDSPARLWAEYERDRFRNEDGGDERPPYFHAGDDERPLVDGVGEEE